MYRLEDQGSVWIGSVTRSGELPRVPQTANLTTPLQASQCRMEPALGHRLKALFSFLMEVTLSLPLPSLSPLYYVAKGR